jgi:hypothetical protein
MQALSDEEQIALEKKIDRGFAEVRAQIASTESNLRSEIVAVRTDARADFRTLIAVVVAMWCATILAFVGALVANL